MARRKRKKSALSRRNKLLILVGSLALFSAGIYFGMEMAKPPPPPDFSQLSASRGPSSEPSISAPSTGRRAAVVDAPAATAPDSSPPSVVPSAPSAPEKGEGGGVGRVALVIDDLGRSLEDLDTLASLGIDITYAVLPFEVRTAQVVAKLHERGAEVLCHLPMEAKGGANPGPGALRTSMSTQELVTATREALRAVPGAAGVNNHMGSGVSAHGEAMRTVLGVVAESRSLYYLDSRTSADSQGFHVAQSLGVPSTQRNVFLDTQRDPEFIREQFARLLVMAQERGEAVAIAHPYRETLEVLAEEIPRAQAAGIRFVRASALARRPQTAHAGSG